MRVGIIGSTGAVGTVLIEILAKKLDKNNEIVCFASQKSEGKKIVFEGFETHIKAFSIKKAKACDVVFLCVSGEFSLRYAEELSEHAYVIDNSSAFRYEEKIPLLVPPVNSNRYNGEKLIANPNCSSAIALVVLAPIHEKYGIENMIISTYQAASGAGLKAINELKSNINNFEDYTIGKKSPHFFHDLAYNVVPQVDSFQNNGYTKEEMKVVWEIKKVLNAHDIKISTTAVRVPVLRSHSESITLKLKRPVQKVDDIHSLLNRTTGVIVVDDINNNIYPMPMSATYNTDVEVGRIRYNLIYDKYGLDFFISGDQLLRGAGYNAYEIYECIMDFNNSVTIKKNI